MTAIARQEVPMPKTMRTLERDARGYPVPFIVLRDKSGKPQFTINDARRTVEAARKRLCTICGKRLEPSAWFIGGSRCFMHEDGAFVDGPTHHDCGEYALRVCPFLALRNYSSFIEARKLDAANLPDDMAMQHIAFMPPHQPERFGFGCTSAYRHFQSDRQGMLYEASTWDYVEWWRNGEQVNAPDAMPALQPLVRPQVTQSRPPR